MILTFQLSDRDGFRRLIIATAVARVTHAASDQAAKSHAAGLRNGLANRKGEEAADRRRRSRVAVGSLSAKVKVGSQHCNGVVTAGIGCHGQRLSSRANFNVDGAEQIGVSA